MKNKIFAQAKAKDAQVTKRVTFVNTRVYLIKEIVSFIKAKIAQPEIIVIFSYGKDTLVITRNALTNITDAKANRKITIDKERVTPLIKKVAQDSAILSIFLNVGN